MPTDTHEQNQREWKVTLEDIHKLLLEVDFTAGNNDKVGKRIIDLLNDKANLEGFPPLNDFQEIFIESMVGRHLLKLQVIRPDEFDTQDEKEKSLGWLCSDVYLVLEHVK